jgi:hypothetical protein
MTGGGGRGSVLAEIHMHVGLVCGPVGKIDRLEGGFTLNGRCRAYSIDIACICKRLAVVIEVVCLLRSICTLTWWVARLARLIGGKGFHPKWPKTEHPVLGIGLVSKPLREAIEKMC